MLTYLILLSVIGCWSSLVSTSCTRRAPSFTDCSTTTGECNSLYSREGLGLISLSLPFPPSNTRTCYRTCHEKIMKMNQSQCKSFETGVHEQRLQIEEANITMEGHTVGSFRVFSPKSKSGKYRKSTNCRYSVQCEPGQLLSYSVTEFNLEPEGNCSDRQECLDWVEITFNNLGIRRKFCGSGELGRVRVEGTNELMFEFASNRETEKEGFSYSVTCIDPGLDQNAVNLGTIQFSPLDKQLPLYSACSQPLNMAPRNTTTEIPRGLFDQVQTPSHTHVHVVEMFGSIFYRNGIIQIRDRVGRVVKRFRGIERLEVANRFSISVHRHYHISIVRTFKGYGTLEISGENANFYQVGANPVFQPTPEEAEAILEIDRAINTLIGDDSFDVKDIYDYYEEIVVPLDEIFERPSPDFDIPTVGPVRPSPQYQYRSYRATPSRIPYGPVNVPVGATRMASEYGNACNAVLRATACTYQALIMETDCKTGLSLT